MVIASKCVKSKRRPSGDTSEPGLVDVVAQDILQGGVEQVGGGMVAAEQAAAEEIDRLKGDGNSVTQDMAAEALENMPGLDNRERAILWQLQNKSWKWNKNPFDKRVGREVYDRMHEEDEA